MNDWAEFRHFRYLLSILERQGFRVAAEELHTSQPNLTVQARQFQERAALRLFRRAKNGRIRPTDTGVAFIAMARLLLDTRDEVLESLRAIERGDIQAVRFGCGPLVDQGLFRGFCNLHREILPTCPVRPTHGDTSQLAEEILSGMVDAAVVTLPLSHPDLAVEEVRRDRLVVCLRKDSPMANRATFHVQNLQENLSVLYHPQRHPDAHERLVEMLGDKGVTLKDYSRASNPYEMQMLVKDGHGIALVREGVPLDEELTTRPIAGVNWTVDTAVVFHRKTHPKTIPVLVKSLKKSFTQGQGSSSQSVKPLTTSTASSSRKRPPQSAQRDLFQSPRLKRRA